MKKMRIAAGALCLTCHFAFAQSSETLWTDLELGYGWTLADKGRYRLTDDNDQMYMSIFHLRLRYYLTDALSIGAGLGVAPYHNYSITAPFASAGLQYDLRRLPRLFTYADVSFPLSVETASSDFFSRWDADYDVSYTSGFAANAGVGYSIAASPRRSLYVALGYHLFRYNLSVSFPNDNAPNSPPNDRRAKHAILLRVGYTFDVKKAWAAYLERYSRSYY